MLPNDNPLPPAWRRSSASNALSPFEIGYLVGTLRSARAGGGSNGDTTVASLAQQVGCSRESVYDVLRRADTAGAQRTASAASVPASSVEDDRVLGLLLALVVEYPDLSPSRLAAVLHTRHPDLAHVVKGGAALARRLRKIVDYKKAVARPALTLPQQRNRLHFVATFDMSQYDDVIWSDEVMIARTGNPYRWRVSDDMKYDAVRVGVAESYMAWGGVSIRHGALPMHVWDRGITVDCARYTRDILEGIVSPWLARLAPNERSRVIVMQDGARAHWGPAAAAWVRQEGLDVLEWPSHSPDLNVIELVWAKLKTIVNASTTDLPVPEAMLMAWGVAARKESVLELKQHCLEKNWTRCIASAGNNSHKTH